MLRTPACFVIFALATSVAPPLRASELALEARVAAQRAIEEVYWRHRSWPRENATPKPSGFTVASEAALVEQVKDDLAKSRALDLLWHRPIDGAQLQAELNRMARDTKDGATLRELFDALGDDPSLIAETLVRHELVERLVRESYATDARLHAGQRGQAEAARVACKSIDCMRSLGQGFQETTWTLRTNGMGGSAAAEAPGRIALDEDEWSGEIDRLSEAFGRAPGALPIGTWSGVEETPEAFVVTAIASKTSEEFTTAMQVWPKVPFDRWWKSRRGEFDTAGVGSQGPFTLPAILSTGCTPGTWSSSVIPGPRYGHAAVWTGAEMIVWGGINNGVLATNSGRRYTPATDSWAPTSVGTGVPQDRAFPSAVWTGTEMILWGGYTTGGSPVYFNSGARYDPVADAWTATSTGANVPSGRTNHVAVWTGTEMIVWGGMYHQVSPSVDVWSNTGGRYDPAQDTWVATSTGAGVPEARLLPAATWTGSDLIVWGGRQPDSPFTYLNTGGRYSPATDTWIATPTGGNVPPGRRAATAVWTGSEMIVWGGAVGSGRVDSGGRFNPATGSWSATSVASGVPSARYKHTAVWTGSQMIVWGGDSGSAPYLNSGGRYDPATDTWSPSSIGSNVPVGRYAHTAIWTGSEMIVWGGYSRSVTNQAGENTGGRYSPATDTWTATSTGGTPPTPRFHHVAIWTGTEMIVWGGYDYVTFKNSGGRYNPATDTWIATSISAATPEARWTATAVWTGTEMIVWGGSGVSGYLRTGGRYNPMSDSWTATSITDAPAGRTAHAAVWTGRKMIVWGGGGFPNGPYENLNSGGLYDPDTDSWKPTSTGDNVPGGRCWHTAVWTGTEMIVWGGNGDSMFGDGGRYDPSADTWAPTSTKPGVPSSREFHWAAWTGSDMVVWGGSDLVTWGFDTGGRFDPRSDTWTPTSTGSGVPGGRFNFTSVWTGTEMIVWGGSASGWYNGGGRYDPRLDSWIPVSTGAGVPSAREHHSAVWTGTQMIVWGGERNVVFTDTGGSYCIGGCAMPGMYYADRDGDGFGDPTVGVPACTMPPGHVDNAADCDDADAAVFPNAPEVKDGKANACGSSVVDEVTGATTWNGTTFSWLSQAGASDYQVVRGATPNFKSDCQLIATMSASIDDPSVPEPGAAYFYLVRSLGPGVPGSWGQYSTGQERANGCLSP